MISENGEVQEDMILKDLPSDLNSTFAEDSTVSGSYNLESPQLSHCQAHTQTHTINANPYPCPCSQSAVEDNTSQRKDSELESYRLRLKEELISRDGYRYVICIVYVHMNMYVYVHIATLPLMIIWPFSQLPAEHRDLSRQSQWFTLQFLDGRKEAQFVIHKEPYAGISSLACPIALVAFSFATFCVISFNVIGLTTALLALIILLSISTVSACETCTVKSRLKVHIIQALSSCYQTTSINPLQNQKQSLHNKSRFLSNVCMHILCINL